MQEKKATIPLAIPTDKLPSFAIYVDIPALDAIGRWPMDLTAQLIQSVTIHHNDQLLWRFTSHKGGAKVHSNSSFKEPQSDRVIFSPAIKMSEPISCFDIGVSLSPLSQVTGRSDKLYLCPDQKKGPAPASICLALTKIIKCRASVAMIVLSYLRSEFTWDDIRLSFEMYKEYRFGDTFTRTLIPLQ